MRIMTKGPKVGACNICGNIALLTEDHIPPKGVSRLSQVAMMNITDLLSASRPRKSTRYFQNGAKFRTLCAKCNNERLGVDYDPVLVEFTNRVRAHLESSLHLPPALALKTKPNRMARSIVGHLLAQGISEHRNGVITSRLTDYFLDETAHFPENVRAYYWLYPYNDHVIIKGAALSVYYWNSFATFMLLKFFPLSFFFVVDEPPEWRIPYQRLDTWLTGSIDEEMEMPIEFTHIAPQRWPEAPGKERMVMHGQGSIGVVPRVS